VTTFSQGKDITTLPRDNYRVALFLITNDLTAYCLDLLFGLKVSVTKQVL
jgi:hypothetical protein